jgi:hypothetical protein
MGASMIWFIAVLPVVGALLVFGLSRRLRTPQPGRGAVTRAPAARRQMRKMRARISDQEFESRQLHERTLQLQLAVQGTDELVVELERDGRRAFMIIESRLERLTQALDQLYAQQEQSEAIQELNGIRIDQLSSAVEAMKGNNGSSALM